jgi:hypothetical protein
VQTTVSLITYENQQNTQIIYIFSICSTYMFRSFLCIIRVSCNTVIFAFVQDVIVIDEFSYNFITDPVTTHPDDGQKRPKHVGATNLENIYHLCIFFL